MIKHVWLDFSETLAFLKKENHDNLRYTTYAEVVGKPLSQDLIEEYTDLYEKFNHSNAAVFKSLGTESSFWSAKINSIDPGELYKLSDPSVPNFLKLLKDLVPVSLFSNIELSKILPALDIDTALFTNVLSSKMLKEPKPSLEGYYKIIELSHLPAEEILYVGDHVGKDIIPAKKVGIQAGLMWSKSPEADYCFGSFQEILNLIKSQETK